jgi:hypothetical protein
MATTDMRNRHSRTTDNSTSKLQICSGGNGIFHKMDRGEASSQHNCSGTQKILLVEQNMPFRGAQRDNSQQRQAIRLSYIQEFLSSDGC